ncbi:MAG: hypothetical protein K9N09_10775 [Candidatus Cloacimonetes bacterium]|nr:hypothetical protein [Candidatus Cloacimonadota bacterium]MCF7813467.1 hypothetical protein [Candidatus Cloacimonadota bacterium]MCF7869169.1 hypothetical protein [Candidatus Cloacimonadota bacterium]MCF7883397.1 hypothetical protein [Candidatus Cloacimonadota bacterium]
MSIINDILIEEKNRLLDLLEQFEKELRNLPKGSISYKERGKHIYCYRAFRAGKKIIFQYLGKENSDQVNAMKEKILRRKNLEQKINEIKKNLQEVRRGLGEKQK